MRAERRSDRFLSVLLFAIFFLIMFYFFDIGAGVVADTVLNVSPPEPW